MDEIVKMFEIKIDKLFYEHTEQVTNTFAKKMKITKDKAAN